jgi:two-component system phosphate regulon sensor histidine kinase PhoR
VFLHWPFFLSCRNEKCNSQESYICMIKEKFDVMKNNNPVYIVFLGSFWLSILVMLSVFIVHIFNPLPIWAFVVFPVGISLGAFIVFYFLFKKFIYTRLKILYRSIRKGKMNVGDKITVSMTRDIIGETEAETQLWAEEKQTEIVQLKEQDKFRREFLGNLAHELKTPVFSIQGYVLTLLEGGLEDDRVNRMFLERAEKAIERMTNILDDLDTLTRMEVNELKLLIRPFDIRELAKEVMDSFEIKAREKGITIRFSKDYSKEIMVAADKGKIAQVLTNLISNSISYGNQNGETLVRIFEVDDLITIEISDNGPGIEPDEVPRLFERFYRVEKSRNRNEGGSGLGLSIVKHILDAHQQTISVRSSIGIGSTFTFSLDKFKGSSSTIISSRGMTIK